MALYPSTQSNIILGPVAVVIGANRHKIPASPYRSRTNQLPVDQIPEGGSSFFKTTIYTPDNNPLNIVDMKLRYVVRDSLFTEDYTEIDCTVIRPDFGEIEVYIPSLIMSKPGLHLASIQVYNIDGQLIYQSPRYLEITPKVTSVSRPVTVSEVRFALRDYPESNTLLNDVEFSDNEIAFCISRPVEKWNEMLPNVGHYDLPTSPFRQAHINATIGELFKIAAYHYMRNHLPYSAGGLSVDDKNKAAVYLQLGEQELAKFERFCAERKFEANFMGGFLTLPGPYSRV